MPGEGVAGAAAGRRSGAADGRAGGAEQVVLTGEGTTTGARREAREGRPGRLVPRDHRRVWDGRRRVGHEWTWTRGGGGHAWCAR